MKTTIIDDDLVIQHLSAAAAIEAVEAALTAQVNGTLTAPARLRATLDDGDLVFTVGAFNEGYGLRVCDTVPTASDDQITVLWSRDGHLRCIVVGPELGRRRTAAIDRLVKVDAQPFIGVLGAGQQAYTQLWAISTLRHITAQCSATAEMPRPTRLSLSGCETNSILPSRPPPTQKQRYEAVTYLSWRQERHSPWLRMPRLGKLLHCRLGSKASKCLRTSGISILTSSPHHQ